MSAELDDDVAAFKAGFFCGATAAHAAELNPLNFSRVIGDRAEISAELIASATGSFDMRDLLVIRPFLRREQIQDNGARKCGDALHALVINFVGFVCRPMIILMAAGKKIEHWNSFGIECRHIRRKIRIFLQHCAETGRNIPLFNEFSPDG